MLELRNVSYVVNDEETVEILKNISFKTDDRFVAITGPNGGGKSTLAKLIAGILIPTEGQILFNGQDITHMSITERAQNGISYAFQQPVRFKGLTVRDLIGIAAGRKMSLSETCQVLSEVGICAKDYIDREVNASLSGGEMKRIEIAMMLARKTPMSIFDEPEAGIDLWSFTNLIQVFEKMNNEVNGTIMVITHQERLLNVADTLIVLADGKIDRMGPREEILPGLLLHDNTCSLLTGKVK